MWMTTSYVSSTQQLKGKVTGLWIWSQSYLSLLWTSKKGSTVSEGTGTCPVKNTHKQTGVRGGCNVQYVLILPTNLRLHLPWLQGCCEGKPPFLATWPLNRGHAWSHSSLCLEPSGPQWPRRCDEYRSRSRSGNLKNRRRKTIISKIRLQF